MDFRDNVRWASRALTRGNILNVLIPQIIFFVDDVLGHRSSSNKLQSYLVCVY